MLTLASSPNSVKINKNEIPHKANNRGSKCHEIKCSMALCFNGIPQ